MKKPKFPILVKVGSAVVKIYHTPANGYDGYTVDSHFNGRRERFKRSTLDKAKDKAQEVAKKIANGEAATMKLSTHEAQLIERIKEHCKTVGRSPDGFIDDCLESSSILGKSATLTESARYYFKKHFAVDNKPIPTIVSELVEDQRAQGLSPLTIRNTRQKLGNFGKAFTQPMAHLTGIEISSWLNSLKINQRSRNHYRSLISTLVSFAKARKYLPKEWDELADVKRAKVFIGQVKIFTPEQLSALIEAMDEDLIPFLTIGAFGGIRHYEIKRLNWSHVNFQTGYITVNADASKPSRRRLVPVLPNLRLWLWPRRQNSGPLCRYSRPDERIAQILEKKENESKNIKWIKNGLRHSFCSYRLAIVKSAAQVTLEAGNSPKMLFEHYRELVTEAEAQRWFSIVPGAAISVTNPSPQESKPQVSSGN